MYESGNVDGLQLIGENKDRISVDIGQHHDVSFESPVRKKRKDHGLENYTPQRQRSGTPSLQSKNRPRPRRSMTPEVRYEAPQEEFTPPRAVVKQAPLPSSSRSRTHKPLSTGRNSVEPKVVKVKIERLTSPFPVPRLDLSRPVPPPSPTDDPILLIGDDEVSYLKTKFRRSLVDVAVGEDTSSPPRLPPSTPPRASPPPTFQSHEPDESGWNVSPDPENQTALLGITFGDRPIMDSTFNAGFDSDNDDCRMGAEIAAPQEPISLTQHFDPNASTGSHVFHSDDGDVDIDNGEAEGEFTGRFKFYTTPLKNDPPSSLTKARRDSWGRPISPFPYGRSRLLPSEASDDEGLVCTPPLRSPSEELRKSATPRPVSLTTQSPLESPESQTPESHVNHAGYHLRREQGLYIDTVSRRTEEPQEQEQVGVNEGNNSEDDELLSPGMVQVTSSDPGAAARAAAILKLVSFLAS